MLFTFERLLGIVTSRSFIFPGHPVRYPYLFHIATDKFLSKMCLIIS